MRHTHGYLIVDVVALPAISTINDHCHDQKVGLFSIETREA
jgi:hypothetical protein